MVFECSQKVPPPPRIWSLDHSYRFYTVPCTDLNDSSGQSHRLFPLQTRAEVEQFDLASLSHLPNLIGTIDCNVISLRPDFLKVKNEPGKSAEERPEKGAGTLLRE